MFYLKNCELHGCEGKFEIMRGCSPYEDELVGYLDRDLKIELIERITLIEYISVWYVITDKVQQLRYIERNK